MPTVEVLFDGYVGVMSLRSSIPAWGPIGRRSSIPYGVRVSNPRM